MVIAGIIRKLTGKQRSRQADMQLGVVLAFIAGGINAGGFMAAGYYTSHMTGMASAIADYIALNKFETALITLGFLTSFIAGAMTSCLIINWAREKMFQSEFALALMLEALLILAFGIAATNVFEDFSLSLNVMVALLCYIMGLQNAVITKISNAEIRTTHITGIATDIGIEIGRCAYFHNGNNKTFIVSANKLKLHAGLLISFITGGIIGAISFKTLGFVAIIPFSFILAAMASVPIYDDVTRKRNLP